MPETIFTLGRLFEKHSPGNEIKFYYSEVTDNHETGWIEDTVIGRSEPFQFYASGSAMEITLPVFLVAGETSSGTESAQLDPNGDYFPNTDASSRSPSKPMKSVSLANDLYRYRSWTYPLASGGGLTLPPKTLILVLNKYMTEEVLLRNYTINAKVPWGKDGFPTMQEIELNLIRVHTRHGASAPVYSQIKRGG